ncbi:hypothetical protein SAMN06297280_0461 [Arsukibacterium tuosuense]|uniref:DUF1496 domain-containing protein n=1 Tax=Arsukibacterium tuosuense TaxID=1323745 RepID=A0A285I3Q4_9GAMM|nr:hypothetical protein [Arsukibacterium tuosuense]SNY42574.1 hypothetical protein SAMN06297280_0461 [Arsukibacterium tuosuense]
MTLIRLAIIALCMVFTAGPYAEESANLTDGGISVSDKNFPWQLVVDRGKILGCVYDNKFYSLGAILILESLPRKCELASDRNGIWEQLTEAELLLWQESIEEQQATKQEANYIGNDPINDEEARLIRYLRSAKKRADTQ